MRLLTPQVMALLSACTLCVVFAGCAEQAAPPGGVIPEDDKPLLERVGTESKRCELSTVNYGDGELSNGSAAITAMSDGFLVAVANTNTLSGASSELRLVSVGADGQTGPPQSIPLEGETVSQCALAATANGALVAWQAVAGTSEELRWSLVDAEGEPVSAATTLTSHSGGYPFRLQSVIRGDGAAAWLWTHPNGLYTQIVDDAAGPHGEPLLVTPGYPEHVRGVAMADGYLLTWTRDTSAGSEVVVLSLDAAGNAMGEPTLVSEAASETVKSRSGDIVALNDGGFIVAFSEQVMRGEEPPGGDLWIEGPWSTWPDGSLESTVLLQRLDASGVPVGSAERLQTGVPHMENVEPALAVIDGDVAVLWTTGRVIYICAGCIRDNSLQLVLLDAADLTPKSQVAEVPPKGVNGLFLPQIAASGDALGVTFIQDFHALSRAGWAHLSCTDL